MALNTVKLNGGTAGNPVVLSARQINGLIALYKDSNVTKDCSGYVKAASGKLTKSEYIYIQNLGFTIVDTATTPDKFTLYAANNNILYEGKSVQLYSTGLDIKDLVLSVAIHEIIINSGSISEEVIKSRIHISETGLVTVDDAEENATWQDVITIQAYPSFDPTNKVLISNPITIKGVAMSGVNITVASSVIIGGRLNIEVKVLPEDHSKNNYRLNVFANDGTINNNTYIAPTYKVETAIIAECFLFGGNMATFHTEKRVSVKTPVIICEIKDKYGEEVYGAYISVTDGANQIITQLANGESMTAVLDRTYFIEAFVPEGYTKAVYPETITPKTVETIVTATYYPIQLGVMAVFEDGSYIPYDEWSDIGMPTVNENRSILIGAGYKSYDGESYFIADNPVNRKWSDTNVDIAVVQPDPNSADGSFAVTQQQAKNNTNTIVSIMSKQGNTADTCAAMYCKSCVKIVGGAEIQGWLGSCKQLKALADNITKLNTIRSIIGLANIDMNRSQCWSSNQENSGFSWKLNNNSSSSYPKRDTLLVIPFYDL